MVVRGEDASNSLRCNNVLVGQAYSKSQDWLQIATERWRNNDCQGGNQVPRQNLTKTLRSLQLLKNMELCAFCKLVYKTYFFFISWHVLLNIIRLTVGRIFPTDDNLLYFMNLEITLNCAQALFIPKFQYFLY